ncbi:hypothetical protein QR685DRAFT_471472 [Neurospora intermedia]|uniref:Zn(2)-C6 fungal-type domain-containing protein n=1 Tax=Neurospora intermedia TaxID=5142 RepID=A0ABR3DIQ1_NEUIN
MAFQPPTDYLGSFPHSSFFENSLVGSAEPYDDSNPDLFPVSFPIPSGLWPDLYWEGIGFNDSPDAAYPSSSRIPGPRPTHQAALLNLIPLPAPASAPRLPNPSSQANLEPHGIVSDQALDCHASPNAELAPSPCDIIHPPQMIGADTYSSLPRGTSGSGEDDGFYSAPPGYRLPTSESHHKVQNWDLVAKQPITNLNSANLGQHQHLYGAFHLNPNQLSSSINNAPTLADAVSSSQPWQPVGASRHSGWPDQENGSYLIQECVDELTDAGNQWHGSQEHLYNWVPQPCDGYDEHDVDRESAGFDHSVGVQSSLDGFESLIPYSTSRTPQLRDDPPTPSLSSSATTPESTGNSGPPTPEASLPKSIPKSQPATFQFIQYTAGSNIGDRTSKKRLIHDDDDKDGSAKIVREDVIRDQEGRFKGIHIVFHPREKPIKKVQRTEEQKRTSKLARKNGVCYWCKEKKRKCDLHEKGPFESCGICATQKTYKGVLRMPCFTSTLADMLFFRAGPAVNEPLFIKRETVFRLTDFSKPNVGVIKLELTQNIGKHHLVVYASQFDPLPGDKLSYTPTDRRTGRKHNIPMPHFCLTNYDEVHFNMTKYFHSSKQDYLHMLKGNGGLTWDIVSMAIEYAETKKDSLVDTALNLWVICRMIEDPWELLENNKLGVSRVNLPGTKFHGKIPIPPMMDTQLDQVIIQFVLNNLRGKLIGLFERNISPAKPETWFETFLASFIMLTHIERLAAHSVRHAETHTMPTKYSNTKFLEQAFHTAKIVLSRFHYACNGSIPLGLDWKDSQVSSMAKLGPKEVEFMQRIQKEFKKREDDLRNLPSKREYETDGHWYHQLFIEDWDKSPVDVKDPYV